MRALGSVLLALPVFLAGALSSLTAAPAEVLGHQKISAFQGAFLGTLDPFDFFGTSAAPLGDFNGDGTPDVVVGARGDDDGGTSPGAVWLLFLNTDGTVGGLQKISQTAGSFTGDLDTVDRFGWSVVSLGDLDRDGVTDIAVGATFDDDGSTNAGAVWLLFLNPDGTVKSHNKISSSGGQSLQHASFGSSLARLNDLDGDGRTDIAVGAVFDDDGGQGRGALWILSLNSDGSLWGHQKISDTQGNFTGELDDGDRFGWSVASLDDLDGDGVDDIATGAIWDSDGGLRRGAVWVLFLRRDGTVKSHQKISSTEGGFTGALSNEDAFGYSLSNMGDIDGDGVVDLAVGANDDDDGGFDRGAVWVLFLNPDGTVKGHQKISETHGGFEGPLNDDDEFGNSVAFLGDIDGDGLGDMAVGADLDDELEFNSGALWVLFLDGRDPQVPAISLPALLTTLLLLLVTSTTLLLWRRRRTSS